MNKLIVKTINIKDKDIRIDFEVIGDKSWVKLFNTPYTLETEYDISIDAAPASVAVIPFVADFLHTVWLFDAEMYIPDIDKAYYESIPELKKDS